MGGGDNLKILKKLIREFEKNYKNKTFLIILGFKNDKIKIKKNTINNYIIRNNVKNLETLMQNSEKILCSGGTVLLESMIYKISRNVIITADNQKSIVEYFFNKKLKFLPLVSDLSNPSPNQGWMQHERKGLIERFNSNALIALALEHHLIIGKNIPIIQFIEWIKKIAKFGLLEFVPKTDETVSRMLISRKDIFENYNELYFEKK